MNAIRSPAVAGYFYPAGVRELRELIGWCFDHPLGPGPMERNVPQVPPRAVVSPHAGYRYCGPIAAHAYRALQAATAPDLVVVVGPNHHQVGARTAVPQCQAWRTPLGPAAIDLAAAAALRAACSFVVADDSAHAREHSIEVQVPFLQHVLGRDCRLLPVVVCEQDLATSLALGMAIAEVARTRNVVIVASSDFSHYESHEVATKNDRWALRAIEELDAEGLMRAITQHRITMCGPGPVIAAIAASRALGAQKGRTLRYATSGETGGDYDRVVGYAAVEIA
jgi:AmmeMemoRadiSam system protein B